MRLRTDLWRGADPSSAFSQLKERLKGFLLHPEWTTLLLKGPWGCGKTSAVKSLLEEAMDGSIKDRLAVKTYSFISLAGVSKIGDERSLFLSGFENWNVLPIKKIKAPAEALGRVAKTVLGAFGYGGRAEGLPDLLSLAMVPFMKGALVVLDDVERRSDSLPLEDVLGALMRLVEHRQCKVIVISNEDALKAGDKERLDAAREKVFDLEYKFTPSVKDSVTAIVPEGEDRQRILAVFEAIGLNNLRIVSKVHATLKEFERHLSSEHPLVSARVLENVAKISAFRWSRGVSIGAGMLESALGIEIRQMSDSAEAQVNPIADLLIATDFGPCAADEVILSYLETGRIRTDKLAKACEIEKGNARERSLLEVTQKLADQFNSSFEAIDSGSLDEAERVLNECIGACSSWAWPYQLIWLLRQCGRSIDESALERQWATEFPLPEGGWASEFAKELKDDEARAVLEQRFAARESFESTDRLSAGQLMAWVMREHMEKSALGSQSFSDPDWLFNQLRSAQRPKLLISMRELWQKIGDPKDDESLRSFRDALDSALDRLADISEISKARVDYIRSSVPNRDTSKPQPAQVICSDAGSNATGEWFEGDVAS